MTHDWNAVYDVLVREAGALQCERGPFVRQFHQQPTPREWRFQGSLGFGGKVWDNGHGAALYVNCYPEDATPERREIIERTNMALRRIEASTERTRGET